MKDLEKQIEEAAELNAIEAWGVYINDVDEDCNSTRGEISIKDFIAGAKSEIAKEYWQQGMYSEENVQTLLVEYAKSEYAIHSRPIKFFTEYLRNKRNNL